MMIDMGTPQAKSLKPITDSVVELAVKDGRAAGIAFGAEYSLGQNPRIDQIILEGLEANVSIIVQRLPWATAIPIFTDIPAIRDLMVRLSIDPDHVASEVMDDLVWTYVSAYDEASRNVIRDIIRNAKDRKG